MTSQNKKHLFMLFALLLVPIVYYWKTLKGKIFSSMGFTSFQTLAYRLLVQFEGFSPTPYKDHKQWSIGYGSYAGPLYAADGKTLLKPLITSITKEDAKAKLVKLIDKYHADYVEKQVKQPINDNQRAALVSFAYNIPAGATAVISLINKKAPISEIEKKWNAYVYASGVPNATLIDRRKKEFAFFNQKTTA